MLFGQNSLTTQLVNLGKIEKALGICYMPPTRNSDCGAPAISNASRIVLGYGPMPTEVIALGGIKSMQSAPLLHFPYPPDPGVTEPTFPEFRTQASSVSILDFAKQTAIDLDVSKATVLW